MPSVSTSGQGPLSLGIGLVESLRERIRLLEAAVGVPRGVSHHDALTYLPNRLLFRDRLQQSVAVPYAVTGGTVDIGTSIAIAIARREGEDPDELLSKADHAL